MFKHSIRTLCILGLTIFLHAQTLPILSIPKDIVNVKDAGAKGDGVTDDRTAVQSAIDSLANGGMVCFPAGTYLMDSYITAKSGDRFNLVTSHDNTSFAPCAGSPPGSVTILQGPKVRQTSDRVFMLGISNSEFFMKDTKFGQNGYQTIEQNGRFYTLNAVGSGATSVTFSTASQAGTFKVGDWIAVSISTDQGPILPLEVNQVTSVNTGTGAVGLRWPQTVAYSPAYAAKVTHMVRQNISIDGMIFRGAMPLMLNCLYNVQITRSSFIANAPRNPLFANAVRGLLLRDDVFDQIPLGGGSASFNPGSPGCSCIELPQNNSSDVLIDHCTFNHFKTGGMGEFNLRWQIRHSTFRLVGGKADTVTFTGLGILVEGNRIESTAPSSQGLYALADGNTAPNRYHFPFGHIVFSNNTISSTQGGIDIHNPDTVVTGNTVVASGGRAMFIRTRIRKYALNTNQSLNVITGNTFTCAGLSDPGCIFIQGSSPDGPILANNTIIGTGSAPSGIHIQLGLSPEAGILFLTGNTITGFTTPLNYTPSNHPNALVEQLDSDPDLR